MGNYELFLLFATATTLFQAKVGAEKEKRQIFSINDVDPCFSSSFSYSNELPEIKFRPPAPPGTDLFNEVFGPPEEYEWLQIYPIETSAYKETGDSDIIFSYQPQPFKIQTGYVYPETSIRFPIANSPPSFPPPPSSNQIYFYPAPPKTETGYRYPKPSIQFPITKPVSFSSPPPKPMYRPPEKGYIYSKPSFPFPTGTPPSSTKKPLSFKIETDDPIKSPPLSSPPGIKPDFVNIFSISPRQRLEKYSEQNSLPKQNKFRTINE